MDNTIETDIIANGYDLPMSDAEYQAWLDMDLEDISLENEYLTDLLEAIDTSDIIEI